jgi:hypothetical protein
MWYLRCQPGAIMALWELLDQEEESKVKTKCFV